MPQKIIDRIVEWTTVFWDWVDNRAVVRRVVLFTTLWMTWKASVWSIELSMLWLSGNTTKGGMEVAAVVTAMTAPITILQGYVLKMYVEAKS